MKAIYLLLTRSDTYLSRIIVHKTEEAYTHSSISFCEDLSVLYSFGRKYPRLLFPAGLIQEGPDRGFLRLHRDMPCAVLKLMVEDEIYFAAKKIVEKMMLDARQYRYSMLGLWLCQREIPLEREHHYFCSQFVAKVLSESGAAKLPKQPSLMHPIDFFSLPGVHCLYTGKVGSLTERENLRA